MGLFVRLFGSLFLVGVLVVAGTLFWGYRTFEAPGPNRDAVTVVIPPGTSLKGIARILHDAGAIHHPDVFVYGTLLEGRNTALTAGEYRFDPGIRARAIIDKLVAHDIVLRFVTLPEGLNSREIIAALDQEADLSGTVSAIPPEGSLLPETYGVTKGEARDAVIARMQKAMDTLRAELWEKRQPDLPIKSWEEAVVLASIVEKETAVAAERGKVAGVFVNRMRIGMRLQSDPTVIFALTKGEAALGRALTRRDLKVKDPYNTYTTAGLPPTPICNPGRDAIAAVLNPEETDALYFVADGTGGHAFARTLDQHNRNVAKWRRIQRERK